MPRMLKLDTAALALALLFLAASPAAAQGDRLRPARAVDVNVAVAAQGRAPALGCCKCLGGTNSLDLSTVTSNPWTVNSGAPVAFLTSIHPAWNVNPGPAKWVSTVAGGASATPVGDYEYRLDFVVPACTIGQDVTLTGNAGGDDNFDVYLDSTTPGTALRSCAGWCFNTQKPLQTFTKTITSPGLHTLIVKIHNDGGPSGMFVNATLTGACRRE